ncbi:hypothetical protein WK03_06655 [Burkholderia cepacia]|nr:hypothetical protein WK03_06655 [Burkholderia cepacia]
MARRKAEFQTLDPSTWPTVAWTEFDAAERESIRARTTAIEQYARGAPIKEIEQSTGVNCCRSQFLLTVTTDTANG